MTIGSNKKMQRLGYASALAVMMVLGMSAYSAVAKAEVAPVDTSTTTAAVEPEKGFNWKHFGAFGVAASQGAFFVGTTGFIFSSGTGGINWAPEFRLSRLFVGRGEVGAYLPKTNFGTYFFVSNAEAFMGFDVLRWLRPEVGGGLQMWTDRFAFFPVVSGGLNFMINKKWFGLIDRIRVGYSGTLASGQLTNQMKAGVGVAF